MLYVVSNRQVWCLMHYLLVNHRKYTINLDGHLNGHSRLHKTLIATKSNYMRLKYCICTEAVLSSKTFIVFKVQLCWFKQSEEIKGLHSYFFVSENPYLICLNEKSNRRFFFWLPFLQTESEMEDSAYFLLVFPFCGWLLLLNTPHSPSSQPQFLSASHYNWAWKLKLCNKPFLLPSILSMEIEFWW